MNRKFILFVPVLVFFNLAPAFTQQNTHLSSRGFEVTLVNNGTTLRWQSYNSYPTQIYIKIHYADGSSEIKTCGSVSESYFDNSSKKWESRTVSRPQSVSLRKRATGISHPTDSEITRFNDQREAAQRAESAEYERSRAAENAEWERRQAAERAERERKEAAERNRRETEERTRREAPAFLQSGTEAFQRGDYDRAIADFTRSLQGDPRNPTAYNNRGAAYNNKKDWDRAIADFTEAVRLDPNYAAPYRHRAFSYMQKGNFTQARTDVNRALQINPNYQSARELSAELQRRGY